MRLVVKSAAENEVIDITDAINKELENSVFENGLANIFVKHTTAALTISEVGEGTEEDLLEVVKKLIPKIDFRHAHNPSHALSHMIGSLVGQSLIVPVNNKKLDLGPWQRIIVLELNGPRKLEISTTIIAT